jgi:Protein of unknown function (DUF4232)
MIAPPRPPSHDELEALIKEARERQLRRRLLGAATLAIVGAIGLAVYAVTIGSGRQDGITSGSPGGKTPLCKTAQLSATAIWDGAAGNLFNFFTIANRGGGACLLPTGRPTVLLTRRGSPLKVDERAGSNDSVFGPGKPVRILAPGRRAVVHLDWLNWCGNPHLAFARTTTTVTVQFRDGLRVTAPDLLGQPPCMNRAQPSVITVSRLLTPS